MNPIDDLLNEYTRMRNNGMQAKEALRALRGYVEPLPQKDKQELANKVRAWEAQHQKGNPPRSSSIKPIERPGHPPTQSTPNAFTSTPVELPQDAVWVECPNCERKNKLNDVFCYHCGHMLDEGDAHSTKTFGEGTSEMFSDEYYGMDSVLVLIVRDTRDELQIRPQHFREEVVVGRSSENQTIRPDVDLAPHGGNNMGVSRLHLAISYDAALEQIMVRDMGSANGSFLNGEKLSPTEERVLRNGDQVRLGRMNITVHFHHPGAQL